jgi:hypothetical protein
MISLIGSPRQFTQPAEASRKDRVAPRLRVPAEWEDARAREPAQPICRAWPSF